MTKIISMCQHKGGVGKTTSTAQIGSALAMKKKKTLLIDLDPQANLTRILGIEPNLDINIYNILKGESEVSTLEINKYLSLIPADISLFEAERQFIGQGREAKLRNLLNLIKDDYDVILIDCCPGVGTLLTMALLASTDVILPIETEYLALHGISIITNLINDIKELNTELNLSGAFSTKYDKRRAIDRQVNDEIKNIFKDLAFKTPIRKNVALVEAGAKGVSIFDYDKNCHGANDYNKLTNEIIKRILNNG